MSGAVNPVELLAADRKATYTQEARDLIEQAGRGLADVYHKLNANICDQDVLTKLTEINVYIADATRLAQKHQTLDAPQPVLAGA